MREFKGDWRDLFFGFRIALDLRKMFLGLLGAVFSFAGLAVIVFLGALPKSDALRDALDKKEFFQAFHTLVEWVQTTFLYPVQKFLENPGRLTFFPSASDSSSDIWPWLVMGGCFIWIAFVWSKFGGGISRITVVEIAKDERITIHESLLFAKKKFTSFFWSTVAVAVAFFFFFLVNLLGGLVGGIPYAGPILVAILSPFAFLGGFVMMLIGIGGFFGWPLMAPAVAAEGTDAFDAVSRAFSYIYTRPWQYLFYWLVTGVYGLFSVGFVWIFTLLMVRLSIGSCQVGMGSRLDPVIRSLFEAGGADTAGEMTFAQVILAVVLGTVVMVIYGLALSYLISYFYTARSLMYFILRRKVDSTEMTEVYLEDDEDDEFFSDDFELEEKPKEEPPSEKAEDAAEEKPASVEAEPEPARDGPAEEAPADEPETGEPAQDEPLEPAEDAPSAETPSEEEKPQEG